MSNLVRRQDVLDIVQEWTYCSDVEDLVRALPAVQPRVKPLVWSEDGDGFCAKGAARTYAVFRLALDSSIWGAVGVDHTSNDPASVMSACQSDHDARILSALGNNTGKEVQSG
jgi:hypothetical protein